MGNYRLHLCTLMAMLGVAGCGRPASQSGQLQSSPAELPQVVATSTVLCDLTQQIAQQTIALTCLLPPNQDPHTYAPIPNNRKALEDADLVLYGGYNYEPSLIKMIDATNTSAPKIAVFEAAVPKPLMGEAHAHADEADAHAAGAAEPNGEQVADPHVWHDPKNGEQIVMAIEQQLAALVPEQAALYQQNASALMQQLGQIDAWIKTQVATVPAANRKLVTTHEALGYYANAYGFELEGTLEGISTEAKPAAARISDLATELKQSKVPAIFVETTTNPKLLETVAKEANVKIAQPSLYIEGPGGAGTSAPTYQTMLIANTCTVVDALGGKCDPTTAPK